MGALAIVEGFDVIEDFTPGLGAGLETSCENHLLALKLKGLRGEFNASQKVFVFQIRKLSEYGLKGIAPSEVFKHRLDRIPQTANDRFAVANLRVDRNARKQRFHVRI